jgi:arsenite/tail-anchored protein-transporting ATPase
VLDDLELSAARWIWVGGKGGVGKTTVAAALAVDFADRGEPVLVLSVDPAHSLGDALGSKLGREPRPLPNIPQLWAFELDAQYERARFLEQRGEELRALLGRGTYLASEEIDEFLSLALPGIDEAAAVLRLLELRQRPEFARLVIDTAPTGHTLRLLDFPRLLGEWLTTLGALEQRHQTVVAAFAPGGATAPAAPFLNALRVEVEALARELTARERTRFVLVTTEEPVVMAETRRFHQALRRAGITSGGLVVNRSGGGAVESSYLQPGEELSEIGPLLQVSLLPEEPVGVEALRRLLERSGPAKPPPLRPRPPATGLRVGTRWIAPDERRLYVVGGKGGVGKSTIASALALSLSDRDRVVLLLGTDPAGSLAEVWEGSVTDQAVPAPGTPRLELRELDGAAAWQEFRAAHQAEADRFFARVLGQGDSAAADNHALQRLLQLAPPGIDELMALLQVVDLLDEAAYNAVVLDTAPTGHLLRLLELPDIALDWAHAIMRLLLRYREVTGLGGVAERMLAFARSVRRLRDALQNSGQTLIAAVALPEALSVPETERLLRRLAGLGMRADVLFINQLFGRAARIEPERARLAAQLLVRTEGTAAVGAPSLPAGPRGAAQLRSFAAAWRHLRAT